MTGDVVWCVINAFKDMGATDDDLRAEVDRLCTDEAYFDEWCRKLPEWNPDAAFYALIEDPCMYI